MVDGVRRQSLKMIFFGSVIYLVSFYYRFRSWRKHPSSGLISLLSSLLMHDVIMNIYIYIWDDCSSCSASSSSEVFIHKELVLGGRRHLIGHASQTNNWSCMRTLHMTDGMPPMSKKMNKKHIKRYY